MPDAPFNPRDVLDAAAASETGVTLQFKDGHHLVHYDGIDTWGTVAVSASEACRAFQIKLSAARRAEQKKLALSARVLNDMLRLTGWENIVTRTLDGNRLWVGVKTIAAFGIERINGMDGEGK